MGWTTMGLPLTSMILVPFVTWCMSGGIGWKGFCYVLAVILVLLAVLTFTMLTNTPEEKAVIRIICGQRRELKGGQQKD